ncbi:hypothetical protein E4T39_04450 [Aureobasidium subglaciale]|nr:hypothetical protein E4T39_04450 [Aureobasidium subglaciale]
MHSTLITIHESPQHTSASPKLARMARVRSCDALYQRNTEKILPHLPRPEDEADTESFPLAQHEQMIGIAQPTVRISVLRSDARENYCMTTAPGSTRQGHSDDQPARLRNTSIALKASISDNATLLADIMVADASENRDTLVQQSEQLASASQFILKMNNMLVTKSRTFIEGNIESHAEPVTEIKTSHKRAANGDCLEITAQSRGNRQFVQGTEVLAALIASLTTLLNTLESLNDILFKHKNAIDNQNLEIKTTIAESLQKKESSSMGILCLDASSLVWSSLTQAQRIPVFVDHKPARPQQNSLPSIPSPTKPRHLRLNHSVLNTIHESVLEETVVELDQYPSSTIFLVQDRDDRQTPESETSSTSSQFEISLSSTTGTALSETETCETNKDYEEAYTKYLVADLQRQKWTVATNLEYALDKTQFLTNQLHSSMSPLYTFITILYNLSGSSETVQILQEQVTDHQATINLQTEETRLAIRDLLHKNQTDIRECEVLIKKHANSNLDLALVERLAINHLMIALATKESADIDKFDNSHDDELSDQKDKLAEFGARVRSLVQGVEEKNAELETCVVNVNKLVHRIKNFIGLAVENESAIRKILRKLLRRL